MALPTAKELKKLAAACRAAGISSFKGEGIEFTLSADAPVKRPRAAQAPKKAAPVDLGENAVETDEMSPEALLFWSVADPTPEDTSQ